MGRGQAGKQRAVSGPELWGQWGRFQWVHAGSGGFCWVPVGSSGLGGFQGRRGAVCGRRGGGRQRTRAMTDGAPTPL